MYCVKKLQCLYILLVFTIACNKSDNKTVEPIESSLIGKWTYTEHYESAVRDCPADSDHAAYPGEE